MSPSVQEFTEKFRAEHRRIRDLIIDLHDDFQCHDREEARALLDELGAEARPHFRYEEEALTDVFGEEYIEQLLEDHDRAIGTTHMLVAFTEKEPISDEDVQRALRCVRSLLPHVSDCGGLAIMIVKLPEEEVESILARPDASLGEDLGLVEWAEEVREQPAVEPSA